MERSYYAVRYRLDRQDRYLIWFKVTAYNDDIDRDGVVIDQNGQVPAFLTLESLVLYSETAAIEVDTNDPVFYDLDAVTRWLRVKRPKWFGPTAVPCIEILGTWNLFGDISRSIDGSFDPDRERTRKIYSKIFWGNNIPALTPERAHYVPYFPKREIKIIREVMADGLRVFRTCVRRYRLA